jgi:hypothetical protein
MSLSLRTLTLVAVTTLAPVAGCAPADEGGEPVSSGSNLYFDPCACLDPSQVVDCRSGTCITYCRTSRYTSQWCDRYYTYISCPVYVDCRTCGTYGC